MAFACPRCSIDLRTDVAKSCGCVYQIMVRRGLEMRPDFSYSPPVEAACGCGAKRLGPCATCNANYQREQREARAA